MSLQLRSDLKLPPEAVAGIHRPAVVLIAEDDDAIRTTIARALLRTGFAVIETADGNRALQVADESPPQLAIVDINLPGANGLNIVARLKSRSPAVPILVMSGTYDMETRVRAFEIGADDFIAKPLDIRELIKRVHAFERTRRAFEEVRLAQQKAEHLRVFAAEAQTCAEAWSPAVDIFEAIKHLTGTE
jgi:DNA-binding response OmpR family regulator